MTGRTLVLAAAMGAVVLFGGTRRTAAPAQAAGVRTFSAAGGDAGAISGEVDAFRTALGGANNGVGNPAADGRREINWDGVPDQFAAPNRLPPDFFNKNSPRGMVLTGSEFAVSANDGVAPVRFGDIDPSYTATFSVFSAQKLFTAIGTNVYDVVFFVPGTDTVAGVAGFGAVFTNVTAAGATSIEAYDRNGASIGIATGPVSPKSGLSFAALATDDGPRIARVRVTTGTAALAPGVTEQAGAYGYGATNVVAIDDFVYGEPQALPAASGY